MSPFYIVLATVAIRLVNIEYGKATLPYVVSIYNKHTGTPKGYQICAGSLVTNSYVLTTRFCLPRHAYKIRYGDMDTVEYPTYSQILHKRYHPNCRPETILSKHMNIKQVVSGSNNIAMALVQKIPDQEFGRLAALDYRTMIGRGVTYCAFDVSSIMKVKALRNHIKKKKEQIDLKTIFKKKKKMLRDYFIGMHAMKSKNPSLFLVRHRLAQKSDISHLVHSVLRFASGVIAPCEGKITAGPSMCVVEKCLNFDAKPNNETIRTPDFGTPLIYDGKIVGIAADVDEHVLKYTPVSPFLNWINDYVKVDVKDLYSKRIVPRKITIRYPASKRVPIYQIKHRTQKSYSITPLKWKKLYQENFGFLNNLTRVS